MREMFVAEIGREVLGPRAGITETMSESPLSEYITGVLAPRAEAMPETVEDAPEIPYDEEDASGRDDSQEDAYHEPPFSSPAIDPKVRPQSIGLMFAVRGLGQLSFCITWARYQVFKESDQLEWRRKPKYAIGTFTVGSSSTVWLDESGQQTEQNRAEISIHFLSRRAADGAHLASIYLVNRIQLLPAQSATAEQHLFQPQLRICCGAGVSVVPSPQSSFASEEGRLLSFLYRRKPVLARGFLCSAVWKEIDPSRAYEGDLEYPESLQSYPLGWPDSALLPNGERERFSLPDVRTEFIPSFSIPSPNFDWDTGFGPPPMLDANALSSIWEAEKIRQNLEPLAAGYQLWIETQRKEITGLADPDHVTLARGLIEGCLAVLSRLREGIELLASSSEARLCFNFANKGMALQASWKGSSDFSWRPFQIAFILVTLPSIVQRKSVDRLKCDLLWVPTGAGKTEAYLFLALFTMAYRRRISLISGSGSGAGAGVAVLTR